MCRNTLSIFSPFVALLLIGNIRGQLLSNSGGSKQLAWDYCSTHTTLNNVNIHGGRVCGTDRNTYPNVKFLICVNENGNADEAVLHNGPCKQEERNECDAKPDLVYAPVCGNDNITYPNQQILNCIQQKTQSGLVMQHPFPCVSEDNPCYRNTISKWGLHPVCANNGYTYDNPEQVKCLAVYQPQLQIVHSGGCHVNDVYKKYGNGHEVCRIAKERFEWNPVCGADDITYPNPFVFLCLKPHLRVQTNTECTTKGHYACVKAYKNTKMINGVPVNKDFTEKDTVCGNDGKNYISENHLDCRTLRDPNLNLRHTGPCTSVLDHPCASVSTTLDEIDPVCGTDGITYINIEALYCSQRRNPGQLTEQQFLHDGTCRPGR